MRPHLRVVRGHRFLLGAFAIDALGTGAFIPFSLLYFRATSGLELAAIGLALSSAALCRIPATVGAGWVIDRIGARVTVIVANLLQAAGFVSFLFVHSFPHLLISALVVQLGNAVYWVAYPALVHEAAEGDSQETWFGLISGLRYGGMGVGGLGASAAVALGGNFGYHLIVALNAFSFAVAAALVLGDGRSSSRASPPESHAPPRGWSTVLRDQSFLLFVLLNVGFALLSQSFVTAAPVFLVAGLGLPIWLPGAILGLNAGFGALGAPAVIALLRGRRRDAGLAVSQAVTAVGYACLLISAEVGQAGAIALGVGAAVCITGMELIQGAIVPAVVNDSASAGNRGRYNSVYQLAFGLSDIITPALMTALLTRGALATWAPLILLSVAGSIGSLVLARRLEPLRRRSGVGTLISNQAAESGAI